MVIDMHFRWVQEYQKIRSIFIDTFIMPYNEFVTTYGEWISNLKIKFDEKYYDKMFMWDKIGKIKREISFADALALLRSKTQDVLFITESHECDVRYYCQLSSNYEFVATTSAQELAECIADEWFINCKLFEIGYFLSNPVLPSDLYVFNMQLIYEEKSEPLHYIYERFGSDFKYLVRHWFYV